MVVTKAGPPALLTDSPDSSTDDEVLQAARLISRAALFSGLRASKIMELAHQAFIQHLDPGDLLFRQGDRGNSLYVIAAGQLRLYTALPNGMRDTLAVLGPPATFGELSVFDRQPRSATAEAIDHCEVVGVPAKALRDAYRSDPDLAEALLRSLAALVRSATARRSTVLFWDLHTRVAAALLEAADHHDGATLYLDAHGATLALQSGGSEAAVAKILRQLERDGVIRQHGLTIDIVDRNRLAALVDG
jgi:CRP/FNR family transcriptional regulator, cyclic AMP receptor protein